MRKKLFGIISFFVIATLLVSGCKKTEVEVVSEPEEWEQAVKPQSEVAETDIIESVIDSEGIEVEPEEEKVENDPYAALVVSAEYAKEWKLLCVYRNNQLYSLGCIPIENQQKYNVGYSKFHNGGGFVNWPHGQALLNAPDGHTNQNVLMTDLPEFEIKDGDELRSYGDYREELLPIEYVGYRPRFIYGNGFIELYSMSGADALYRLDGIMNFGKMTHNGETLIEFEGDTTFDYTDAILDYEYEQNGYYEYSWITEDMKDNGFVASACCREFLVKESDGQKIEGKINTDEGFAVFDIKSIPSGSYVWKNYNVGVSNTGFADGMPFYVTE